MSEILTFGNEILSLNGEALSLDSETPGYVEIGGKSYRTVSIGNQVWLGENLDYQFDGCTIGPSGNPEVPSAWYYNNNQSTYGSYGLLYNWLAVKYLEENKSTLIPGWHVPTYSEFETLLETVGGFSVAGKVLKSKTLWNDDGNGTDDFNFTALPAGKRSPYGGRFQFIGNDTAFFSTTIYQETSVSMLIMQNFNDYASIGNLGVIESNWAYSVRLIKDT